MNPENISYFFDFDGVLLDSVGVKTEAFVELFEPYGSDILEQVLAHHRRHGGISRVDKIEYAHANFIGKPLTPDELNEWGTRYAELVIGKVIRVPWIAGSQEFVEEMISHTTCGSACL